jgi:hypothetical protein
VVVGSPTVTLNGVEVPTVTERSMGWVMNAGTVSLTRSDPVALVAEPVVFVTTQRN